MFFFFKYGKATFCKERNLVSSYLSTFSYSMKPFCSCFSYVCRYQILSSGSCDNFLSIQVFYFQFLISIFSLIVFPTLFIKIIHILWSLDQDRSQEGCCAYSHYFGVIDRKSVETSKSLFLEKQCLFTLKGRFSQKTSSCVWPLLSP